MLIQTVEVLFAVVNPFILPVITREIKLSVSFYTLKITWSRD